MKIFAVFGNNDGDRFGLARVFEKKIYPPPHTVYYAGKKILILHELDNRFNVHPGFFTRTYKSPSNKSGNLGYGLEARKVSKKHCNLFFEKSSFYMKNETDRFSKTDA